MLYDVRPFRKDLPILLRMLKDYPLIISITVLLSNEFMSNTLKAVGNP
jgi:hypothetical protein